MAELNCEINLTFFFNDLVEHLPAKCIENIFKILFRILLQILFLVFTFINIYYCFLAVYQDIEIRL